jgi:hypothetical protein
LKKLLTFLGLSVFSFACFQQMVPFGSNQIEEPGYPNVTKVSSSKFNVPFKSGHLGIHGPLNARKQLKNKVELRDLAPMKGLRSYGISSMEEYAPWFWVEPEKGKFNWRVPDHDYEGLKSAGMKMALSPFVHFVPDWVTKEKDFQGFVCEKHNKETTFPSIFAPSTLKYYDRYYSILAKHYKGKVSSIYPAGTSDFGEIGYPHGVKEWSEHHMHDGWWINDQYARASYSKYLKKKFKKVAKVNKRWGTQYRKLKSIPYPKDSRNRQEWLDFIDWYRTAQTDFVIKLVDLSKKYFPGIPIEFKLGQPYEKPIYGMDIAGLFKIGKKHGFTIRSTAAFVPTHVYGKISTSNHPISFFLGARQATLAKFYGLPFVTEEFAGMPKEMSLPRIFNDATFGVDEVFIGPPTLMSAIDYYRQYGSYIRGEYAVTNTAFYYPLTDHLLKPEQEFPNGLFNASNTLREKMNYGVIDDQMIADNALDHYQYLVMFDLGVMKTSVLKKMESWVRNGGILVHPFVGGRLDVLHGNEGSHESNLFRFNNNSRTNFAGSDIYLKKFGKGALVAIKKPSRISQFYDIVVNVVYRGDQLIPGAKTESEIDLANDGVYASAFRDRVLLFNSSKRAVTKTFYLSPKNFSSLAQPRQYSVSLAPLSLQEVMLDQGKPVANVPVPATQTPSVQTQPTNNEKSMATGDIQNRLQGKMARFQRQMPKWASSGGNPNRVRPIMEDFQKLMGAGKPMEAEKKIDEALAIIEN